MGDSVQLIRNMLRSLVSVLLILVEMKQTPIVIAAAQSHDALITIFNNL